MLSKWQQYDSPLSLWHRNTAHSPSFHNPPCISYARHYICSCFLWNYDVSKKVVCWGCKQISHRLGVSLISCTDIWIANFWNHILSRVSKRVGLCVGINKISTVTNVWQSHACRAQIWRLIWTVKVWFSTLFANTTSSPWFTGSSSAYMYAKRGNLPQWKL